jgi:hypothetical protein
MHLVTPPTVFCLAVIVQTLGLASVVAVRASRDATRGTVARWLFFSALTAVGLATQLMVLTGNILWLPCGITLALMVLGATFDLSQGATDAIS